MTPVELAAPEPPLYLRAGTPRSWPRAGRACSFCARVIHRDPGVRLLVAPAGGRMAYAHERCWRESYLRVAPLVTGG